MTRKQRDFIIAILIISLLCLTFTHGQVKFIFIVDSIINFNCLLKENYKKQANFLNIFKI